MKATVFILAIICSLATMGQGIGVQQLDRYLNEEPQVFNDTIWARQNGLAFGTTADVNLYRGGSGLLKTDDDFQSDRLGIGTAPSTLFDIAGTTAGDYLRYDGEEFDIRLTTVLPTPGPVFQVYDGSGTAVSSLIIDELGSGGFTVRNISGQEVVKINGSINEGHSFFNQEYFSVGRNGVTPTYGGTLAGAMVTFNNSRFDRNANTGLNNPDNYQFVIEDEDNDGDWLGLGWTSGSTGTYQDNIGAAIVFEPVGAFSQGNLNFYQKTSTSDAVAPALAMQLTGGGVKFGGKFSEYNGAAPTNGQLLIGNTGSGTFDAATLTAGSGISITNGGGGITIASTGGATDLTFSGAASPVTLNSSTGTGVTFTAGGINTFSATGTDLTITATEVDGSITNEIQSISVSGTTTATLDLSDDASDASITGAGINVVSVVGDAITITGTEVDGSVTNELPTEGSMIDVSGTAVSVDINELTEETALLDQVSDFLPIYDGSAATNDKTSLETLKSGYYRYRDYRYEYYNEFINAPGTSQDGNGVVALNSGASATAGVLSTTGTNLVGLVQMATGSTTTGRSAVTSGSTSIALGGGSWYYEISITAITNLSALAERYALLFGFFDTYTAANQVDGVYFLYDEGGVSTGSAASANWQQVTASNSVRTFTTTATAVSTGATTLGIEINAAGTLVTYYINGVATGTTHNTNIPTGTSRVLGFGMFMIKSLGTTSRTCAVDYFAVEADYTTPK